MGIPSDLDLAMFVFGPRSALRHRAAFHDATVADLRRIHALGGGDVLFQIEAVLELVLTVRSPAPLRSVVARMMARPAARLAADAPAGARFGVHLCLGDMNHAPIVISRDAAPVVALANAVAARWPAQRPLEFLHAPLAAADRAPSLDDAYYAPLSRLRLGPTRFVAGFAYEHQSLDEQEGVLAMIERAVGGPVGISAACGLGRRTPAEAQASMRRTRELCLTPGRDDRSLLARRVGFTYRRSGALERIVVGERGGGVRWARSRPLNGTAERAARAAGQGQ